MSDGQELPKISDLNELIVMPNGLYFLNTKTEKCVVVKDDKNITTMGKYEKRYRIDGKVECIFKELPDGTAYCKEDGVFKIVSNSLFGTDYKKVRRFNEIAVLLNENPAELVFKVKALKEIFDMMVE